jgi:acyl-CoA reductase-like NAD-dependent aldehyde dehydrogenase
MAHVRSSSDVAVGLVIGGERVETGDWLDVVDPAAPDRAVGRMATATEDHARRAVQAAHEAWQPWSRLAAADRARQVVEALSAVEPERDRLVELLVRENGKPRAEADVELGVFSARAQLAAGLADKVEEVRHLDPVPPTPTRDSPASRFRSEVTHRPVGVVTIIVPFNWPLAICAASLPYALIAGNTVIVKPPPTCPLVTARALELFAGRLPPGVVNVVSGPNEAVAPLITDRRVEKLVFTGSTAAGQTMMRMAAETMTRVTLELGGNDPAIVLDDAELDEAAIGRLVVSSFLTAGQVCMGVKRIYVPRSRYDEVVDGMTEVLADYRVGHGLDPDTTMGPLNNRRQRDVVVSLRDEAAAAGHEVRELGVLDGDAASAGGWFLRPSLILDPSPDARIVTEEQFGPALPILPYDDLDPLIDAVNADWSGLCSSVWTADLDRAASVAARLRTGTTWINDANAVAQDDRAPFGGFRLSGMGRELGVEGMLAMTEAHSVTYPS